jgi:ubiquinone/menaquinone biosynthesis C-methylase UbiE
VTTPDEPQSVCFDRAADYYDQTRSLPSDGRDQVLEILTAELGDSDLCLDVGVGTGRTALPLAAAGVRIIGLDLSLRMMAKIKDKSGGRLPFPLVAADATTMPFTEDSVGGATIIHVLHTVPRWEAAIAEVVRVVRPGGVIVLDTGDGRVELLDEIEARFKQELAERPPPLTRWTVDLLDETFRQHGCAVRLLQPVTLHFSQAPAELLAGLASGIRSWQWSMDDTAFGPAADRVRAWAEEKWGSLDEPRSFTKTVQMRGYDIRSAL